GQAQRVAVAELRRQEVLGGGLVGDGAEPALDRGGADRGGGGGGGRVGAAVVLGLGDGDAGGPAADEDPAGQRGEGGEQAGGGRVVVGAVQGGGEVAGEEGEDGG